MVFVRHVHFHMRAQVASRQRRRYLAVRPGCADSRADCDWNRAGLAMAAGNGRRIGDYDTHVPPMLSLRYVDLPVLADEILPFGRIRSFLGLSVVFLPCRTERVGNEQDDGPVKQ